MGKGEIISHSGDGQYSVKLLYSGRDRVQARIVELNKKLAALVSDIDEVQKLIEVLITELAAQVDPGSEDEEKEDVVFKITGITAAELEKLIAKLEARLIEIEDILSTKSYLVIPVEPDPDKEDPDKEEKEDPDEDEEDPDKPTKDSTEPQPDPEAPNEDDPPPLDGDNTITGTITDS